MAKVHIQGHKSWYSTDHSMRILLVTPLYPPDISEPAPYVKELAKRLSKEHTVTILTYGHVPETVPHVAIISIEKSNILPVRLFHFLRTLLQCVRHTDIVYAQNGPSVELPLLVMTFLSDAKIFFRLGDDVPLRHSLTRPLLRYLITRTLRRAYHVVAHEKDNDTMKTLLSPISTSHYSIVSRPQARPEILALKPYPADALHSFDESWEKHTTEIVSLFEHA